MFITKYIDEEKIKNNPNLLINLVFAFFPISFILGSLFVSINLILFCCLGIFNLRSKILKIKFNFLLKIIFLFFLVILFSTSLSFIKSLYFEGYEYIHLIRLTKSILFFRFFLMLIIVYLLNEFDILNFKYFFLSAAFSSILISLDIIYQYIFGFNIIGFKGTDNHNSGFFGSELIAGTYIQRFSFFVILFTAFALKNKNNVKYILTTITICILGTGILLSGNRMPLILFLCGLFLIFLFDIKLKKIITVSFIGLFVLFKFITLSNETIKNSYLSYFGYAEHILVDVLSYTLKIDTKRKQKIEEKSMSKPPTNFQSFNQRLLLTAIDTWKQNKIFGNGIKSFRTDCAKLADSTVLATEEQKKQVWDLSGAGKHNEARDLVKKLTTESFASAGSSDTNITEEFVPFKKNRLCSNHPHNYYFEILTETGIVGLFVASIIALLFVVFIAKNFKFLKGNNIRDIILLASIISLILELFPFRSTGSLFTTNNATYITLIASVILNHKKLLKINDSK